MNDTPLTDPLILQSERVTRALDFFHQGYNCSQSVFAAFADACGLDEKLALQISAPFGAGIGRMREVCGAFCGLAMVSGVHHGNATPNTDDKEKIFTLVQELASEFKSEFGTIYCRDLLHLSDETKETPRPSERTKSYYDARPCERCVAHCATLAEKLIEPSRSN
ncbi:MAG: C-GCAxxG-C-C family protein [Akkermansia sp.]